MTAESAVACLLPCDLPRLTGESEPCQFRPVAHEGKDDRDPDWQQGADSLEVLRHPLGLDGLGDGDDATLDQSPQRDLADRTDRRAQLPRGGPRGRR